MNQKVRIPIDSITFKPVGEQTTTLSRREFLKGTAVLTGTLATGSSLALYAPSRTWAASMTVLNEQQAKSVLKLTQVIFPHEAMPEAINAIAVKDVDAAVAADETKLAALDAGFAALDNSAGGNWLEASANAQLAAVEANTGTELFTMVRGQCVTSLYDNELAYQHFGYEGEAFTKGGYLTRGFNDLAWLPDPPADASPASI